MRPMEPLALPTVSPQWTSPTAHGEDDGTSAGGAAPPPLPAPPAESDRGIYKGMHGKPTPEPVLITRYHDLAVRLLSGESNLSRLARHYGVTPRAVRFWLADDRFREIYEEHRLELYDNLDDLLVNEKADSSIRRRALLERATTLLANVMTAVNDHAKSAPVLKAAMLKAGVDAAEAARKLATNDGATRDPVGPSAVLNIKTDRINVIAGALKEAGIDLSHILNPPIDVEAEVVE